MFANEIVPETPEASNAVSNSTRRRSSRRTSTLHDSLVKRLGKVPETPQTQTDSTPSSSITGTTGKRGRGRPPRRSSLVRLVEESPGMSQESNQLEETPEKNEDHKRLQNHPLFPSNRELESEDTFVQYVAATQDLASTHVNDKVSYKYKLMTTVQ